MRIRSARSLLALVMAAPLSCGGEEHQAGWGAGVAENAADPSVEAVIPELEGPCRVVSVKDGDSIEVDCGGVLDPVRLLRIDAPEFGEPGADEARDALAAMVTDRDVHLLFEQKGERPRGAYGRLLAYIYANERNVNIEMVKQGWCTFLRRFGEGRFGSAFATAESNAKARKLGLWRDSITAAEGSDE